MITKYSWLLYKRILTFNKLFSLHYLLIIPLIGIIIYILFKEVGDLFSVSPISYVLFFVFLFQTALIIGKRIKNEFFFLSRCYNIFPLKKIKILFFILVFGTIDLNVVFYLIVVFGMIVFVTKWSILINFIFLLIFLVAEMVYLSYMILMTEYILGKYGSSKNLFLITFMSFMFLELYTRMTEAWYLFDYYPISGWIGSSVKAALKGDILQVLLYFGITIMVAIIGLFLLHKLSYPRKNNVF